MTEVIPDSDSNPQLCGSPLECKVFGDISIGDKGKFKRTFTEDHIKMFAEMSGDFNPVHMDEEYAKNTVFEGRIGHGMWCAGILSGAIATVLPGPGAIYRSQTLKFLKPIRIGDVLTVDLTVVKKNDMSKLITLDCVVINQHGATVMVGTAEVVAPTS